MYGANFQGITLLSVQAHTHTHTYIHTYTFMNTHKDVHTHTCACTHCTRMHVRAHARLYCFLNEGRKIQLK